MSNTYFQFKQFRVAQERCSMKVTTDACILGAWTPITEHASNILDIGTGTGLLALMLAQINDHANIDAIELNTDAATQARENIASSPWAKRINLIEGDIKDHSAAHKYDLIICNPPFFNDSLLGPVDARNKARHTISLSYQDLFNSIEKNLTDSGIASVLLPWPESKIWETLAEGKNWHIINTLSIKHKDSAVVKRKVILIGRNAPLVRRSEILVIQNHDGTYTERFKGLMTPYYMNL